MTPIPTLRGFWLILVVILIGACQSSSNSEEPTPAKTQGALTSTPEATSAQTAAMTLPPDVSYSFDGDIAYQMLRAQTELGPRVPGSSGHTEVIKLITDHLNEIGWQVEKQPFEISGVRGTNIIGRANFGKGPVVILGAHFDTRAVSDNSPESLEPVLGANDGASGVAVLLELARTLDLNQIGKEVWLAFFDLEDQGNGAIMDLDYIEGSSYLAENLTVTPEAVVVVDMVADKDQQLPYESYSDRSLKEEIWSLASELGYGEVFIKVEGQAIRDDHLPFIQRGIPAVDIIDFNYPYWHTVDDTLDKTRPESLHRVGRTLEYWLEGGG